MHLWSDAFAAGDMAGTLARIIARCLLVLAFPRIFAAGVATEVVKLSALILKVTGEALALDRLLATLA
jgi:hypothetical protein